jgi:hypothetical protein
VFSALGANKVFVRRESYGFIHASDSSAIHEFKGI